MGRRKLRMQLMADKKARLRHFEKRKKALEKAARELSTLCEVDIGMIVYGPSSCSGLSRPEIWPRDNTDQPILSGLVESYLSTLAHEGRNKTCGLADFFKEKAEEAEKQLREAREKSRPARYPMPEEDRYNCMSLEELEQFHGALRAKIESVKGRINGMKGNGSEGLESFWAGQYVSPVTWSGYGGQPGADDYWDMSVMTRITGDGQGQYGNFACGFNEGGMGPSFGSPEVGDFDWEGNVGADRYGFEGQIGNYTYGFVPGQFPMISNHDGQQFEQPGGSFWLPGIAEMFQ